MSRLPVQGDGRLHYGALARELRGRLERQGLWDCPADVRTKRVHRLFWARVWAWAIFGLGAALVALWGWARWR